MQPYINLYIFMGLTQIFYAYVNEYKSRQFRIKCDNFLFVVYSVLLTMMVATRLETVGTDTETYVSFFRDRNFYYHDTQTDVAFEWLGRFIHIFNGSTLWFILFTGILSMWGIIYLVKKMSDHKSTSMVFFTIGGTTFVYFLLYMSMMRQCCALTYYLIAVYLFFKENRTKANFFAAVVLYVIAVLTHGSALFGLPFILVAYFRPIVNKRLWYILIIGLYILAILKISFVQDILQFVFGFLGETKYQGYAQISFGEIELNPQRSWFLNMFLFPYTVIACMLVYFSKTEDMKKWWMQLTLMGVVANNLFNDNLMWGRLMLYLTLFSIVAIPNIMKNVRLFVKAPFYFIFLSYFFYKSFKALMIALVYSKMNSYNYEVPYESWFFDLFNF